MTRWMDDQDQWNGAITRNVHSCGFSRGTMVSTGSQSGVMLVKVLLSVPLHYLGAWPDLYDTLFRASLSWATLHYHQPNNMGMISANIMPPRFMKRKHDYRIQGKVGIRTFGIHRMLTICYHACTCTNTWLKYE